MQAMQAAASRPANALGLRRAENSDASPHLATADDTALLDALPIAAAVIENPDPGTFEVAAHNSRFVDLVDRSNCTALDWNDAECLKSGPIADLLRNFFDGAAAQSELDFRDGEGVSAQYYRVKLAPLPRRNSAVPRCLLSVVDRTVELQAERTLRAEMLRDRLTGLRNRLAFT